MFRVEQGSNAQVADPTKVHDPGHGDYQYMEFRSLEALMPTILMSLALETGGVLEVSWDTLKAVGGSGMGIQPLVAKPKTPEGDVLEAEVDFTRPLVIRVVLKEPLEVEEAGPAVVN